MPLGALRPVTTNGSFADAEPNRLSEIAVAASPTMRTLADGLFTTHPFTESRPER
jgi:hypothetical protein